MVVYHYSGHGSRVFDPDPIVVEPGSNGGLNGTLVPVNYGSMFTIIGGRGSRSGRVTLESRDSSNGLIGIGTVDGGVQEGTLLKVERFPTGI